MAGAVVLRLALVASLLAALPACTGIIEGSAGEDTGDDGTEDPDDPAGEVPIEPDPYEPAPEPPPLGADTVAGLAAQASQILAQVPYTHSVRVDNATTGQVVFTSGSDRPLIPASNTKLFTTAAALDLLGPDHDLGLVAYSSASISGGVLAGDLTVLGRHDFTPSTRFYSATRASFDRLAAELYRAGLRDIQGSIRISGEFVWEGNSVGYLDVAGERSTAAGQIGPAFSAVGIGYDAVVQSSSLEAPAGTEPIIDHTPLPLSVGCSPINVVSHNEFADLLARHLGFELAGQSSYGAGNAQMVGWLGEVGIASAGVQFGDGSGLSRNNLVSADAVVGLLGYARSTAWGQMWRRTLSTAGMRGTLANRLGGANTAGRVQAKTGTLSNVIALSGYLHNRHDGQEYLFSILFNDVGTQSTARSVSDQVVDLMAQNHREIVGRLPAPEISWVRGGGGDGILDIGWQPVGGAEGYLVWLSADGSSWNRADARLVRNTRFAAGELLTNQPTYVRITALGSDGFESDPSAVLAGTARADAPEVLVVDANDRWLSEPQGDNRALVHHDFVANLAAAMPDRAVASASNEAVATGQLDLADYPVVIYAFGEESSVTETLSEAEQSLLRSYVDSGGRLLLSGAELMWDLVELGSDTDQAFVAEVLSVQMVADDADTHEVYGPAGGGLANVGATSFFNPDTMSVQFPDVMTPIGDAEVLLAYLGGSGGAAAIGHITDGGGRVVTTGFPIEMIASGYDRTQLLDQLHRYLSE